jgi:hypothetical protein
MLSELRIKARMSENAFFVSSGMTREPVVTGSAIGAMIPDERKMKN